LIEPDNLERADTYATGSTENRNLSPDIRHLVPTVNQDE